MATSKRVKEEVEVKPKRSRAKAKVEVEAKPKRKRASVSKKVVPTENPVYAYKVFKNIDGVLHSARVPVGVALHKVYPIGEKTHVPKALFDSGFGILVFEELSQAQSFRSFRSYGGYEEIWKVEVGALSEPAKCRPSRPELGSFIPPTFARVRSYKGVVKELIKHCVRNSWPNGTRMAEYVVPIEKVERY